MVKVYLIVDDSVEDMIYYESLDEFRELIEDGAHVDVEEFETEAEANAYISGVFHGIDERAPAGMATLRDDIESDMKFIDIMNECW